MSGRQNLGGFSDKVPTEIYENSDGDSDEEEKYHDVKMESDQEVSEARLISKKPGGSSPTPSFLW